MVRRYAKPSRKQLAIVQSHCSHGSNLVKSYNEFTKWIKKNGLPDGICFDHDLGKEAEQKLRDKGLTKKAARKLKAEEKTGMDCAKWLVEYCMDNQKELPLWNIQSSNPVGKINISSLLMNFNNKR